MDPLDPEFRRKWSTCLEWVWQRLLAPKPASGANSETKKADEDAEQHKARIKTRQRDVDANQRTGK
jgi:hypothetical protein